MARARKVDEAATQAMADADAFVNSGRERAAANKIYEAAKAALRQWLIPELSRVLPDGRTVTLTVADRDGYEVKAGTVCTVTVSPPPAA